jgi:hypothetical protein
MKRLSIIMITIVLCPQLSAQIDTLDYKQDVKSIESKKQYAGFGFGGVIGNIGNNYIGFLNGYGGSFAAVLGRSAIFEGSLMYYESSLSNVEELPDSTAIDVLSIAVYWDYNLLSPKIPFQPFLRVGISPTWIGTEQNEWSWRDYEGWGLILGTGVEIYIGRFASIYAAGEYKLSWVYSTDGSEDFVDIHEKLVNLWGLQGGLRLIIPIRAL